MRWTIVILLSVIPPRIAQAQTQEKKIGAVTTDARVEIDARDNGDVVIRGFSLVSTIICVSQVGTARDWTKASSAAVDSSAAKQGESAISNGAPMLRGIPECVAQLVRAPAPAPGYRFELKRTSDDARVATTMSPDDARRFLSYMTIAADSAESMVMRRDPTLLARRAPLYAPAGEPYYEYQVEHQAWPLASNPHPKYPPELHDANIEGEVLAEFVVDTLGRPDRSTFKVIKSSHELFTTAVWSVLPDLRFRPAEIRGRKVRQLVHMPFEFHVKP